MLRNLNRPTNIKSSSILNTKNKPTLSNNRVQSKRKEEVVD